MKFNGFIFALVLGVIAAYFFPQGKGFLQLDWFITIGVGLIFFFYGLKLPLTEMRSGIGNYRLHLLIQLATFLFCPLLVLTVYPFVKGGGLLMVWEAFFFLAVVPSTVSSSVILVALARGNVPAAIFNASLSGIIGVAATPFWLGIFITETSSPGFGEIFWKLICQILLPLLFGFLLQRYFEKMVNQYRKHLQIFDKSVIVLIVYASFSASFSAKVFSSLNLIYLLFLFLSVLALFLMMYFGVGFLAEKFGFPKKDKITAKYCGSQKSLVHGSVMAKIIFGSSPAVGFFLLPLMVYHFVQLLVISWIAGKVGSK